MAVVLLPNLGSRRASLPLARELFFVAAVMNERWQSAGRDYGSLTKNARRGALSLKETPVAYRPPRRGPLVSRGACWSRTDSEVAEVNVKNKNLAMMTTAALWSLREELDAILEKKLDAEKQELERRLARLNGRVEQKQKARRPYPKVPPKYRNPERPSETWSGRGKQPRWVGAQLRSGMKVDDLLIARTH
jgi:DNA-binding protein H-NS